jgi:DNA (cytosine-5)-methyltransferase 1
MLDLGCCAGGATKGYQMAGFRVLGVDLVEHPNYCGDDFVKGDALEVLHRIGRSFVAVHASPPCQRYSSVTKRSRQHLHPDLVSVFRAALVGNGRTWVMENIRQAPLRSTLMLCGSMFGLEVRRHRYFEESGGWLSPLGPASCDHRRPAVTVTGNGAHIWTIRKLGCYPDAARARAAMGIDWTTRAELSQAVPPAYTEWIGRQLLASIAATTPQGLQEAR